MRHLAPHASRSPCARATLTARPAIAQHSNATTCSNFSKLFLTSKSVQTLTTNGNLTENNPFQIKLWGNDFSQDAPKESPTDGVSCPYGKMRDLWSFRTVYSRTRQDPERGLVSRGGGDEKKEDDKKCMRGKTEEQHLLPVGVIRHQTHWRKSLETWRGFLLNVKLASFCLSDYLIHTENFSFLGGNRNLKRIYLKYRLVLACLVCMLSYCLGAYYSG